MKKVKLAVLSLGLVACLAPGLALADWNGSEIVQNGMGNVAVAVQNAPGATATAGANISGIYQAGDLNMALHTQTADGSGAAANLAFTYQGEAGVADSNSNVSLITQGLGATSTTGGNQARAAQDSGAFVSGYDTIDATLIVITP